MKTWLKESSSFKDMWRRFLQRFFIWRSSSRTRPTRSNPITQKLYKLTHKHIPVHRKNMKVI